MEKSAPPATRSPRRKDGARKLSHRFEQLKAEYPEATVELWAMDEHRLGLKPIFRRVWTPVGVQPTAEVNWRSVAISLRAIIFLPPLLYTNDATGHDINSREGRVQHSCSGQFL
ncbi:hypothetical protein [Okeania sp. SIO2B3]|uniref:hypothetical protein n=1 Tax=Okeania sp. SIO2B3 TaxID=2607784 RepID=UPI0013C05EA0|nr:hypothetical protein [Okeania sp. SIO2B3]NET45675.1 hypothetical protein [Okeania sp. SIO2B3]